MQLDLNQVYSKLVMSTGSRVIQYATFVASDAFINHRDQFSERMSKVGTADGHISTFWGIQVPEEGAKMGYIITTWESADHYRRFRDTSLYILAMDTLKEASVGEASRHQFSGVVGSPGPGLQSDITEVVVVKPKAGVTGEEVKEAAQKLGEIFTGHGHPAALGESINGDGVYLIVVGWPSVTVRLFLLSVRTLCSSNQQFCIFSQYRALSCPLEQASMSHVLYYRFLYRCIYLWASQFLPAD
ncbi:hypothetical protein GYMLUDRAFT_50606 [Collybiopsis luxurians FD-317 M1]|uniref:ABM domain-containing protein n=1 Tax=Collybiopsis luxurians FD-317 M1 TaxID=944289 RepID=A0A0D0C108_9AGAR|nr:hypothetical protein GYMLUDRAFT_50606 [Collybiopsis luxurians FD-317 M1]